MQAIPNVLGIRHESRATRIVSSSASRAATVCLCHPSSS